MVMRTKVLYSKDSVKDYYYVNFSIKGLTDGEAYKLLENLYLHLGSDYNFCRCSSYCDKGIIDSYSSPCNIWENKVEFMKDFRTKVKEWKKLAKSQV
jgi:hypothetical protein